MKRKKKTPPTAAELALAVREERMEFDDALLEYMCDHHTDRMMDFSFFMTIKIAIGYAAMGDWQKEIPFSDEEKMTVKEVIANFGLEPFVEQGNAVRRDPDAIPGTEE
jgi:hypothetical protein